MRILQDLLNSRFQGEPFNTQLKAKIILRRLQNLGFKIGDEFLQNIELKLVGENQHTFQIQFEDEHVPNDYKNCEKINDLKFTIDLNNLYKERDEIIQELSDTLTPDQSEKVAKDLLKIIRYNSRSALKQRKKARKIFESNLNKHWNKPIDLLEEILAICMESCADLNAEWQSESSKNDKHKVEVLIRLHARACKITSEILALLRTGHADGAHARWRSLHEVAVVGLFIANHDDTVADRYILHDAIECAKAANQYQKNAKKLNLEPISEKELQEILEEKQLFIEKYGKCFNNNYGWASEALGISDPNFSEIEKNVKLDHIRPFYRLASHNIHANPRGAFIQLGLMNFNTNEILAGTSNYGLAEPGHACAISLSQITAALLTLRSNFDRLVICNIVKLLTRQLGEAFLQAQKQLEVNSENHPLTTHNN